MTESNIPARVLKSEKPKDRECEGCPRYLSMCKGIYDLCGELPRVELCPIWSGLYDVVTKRWYFQSQINHPLVIDDLEAKINESVKKLKTTIPHMIEVIKVDPSKYILDVDMEDRGMGILHILIEKRKIDYILHDEEYLFELLTEHKSMQHFAKTYKFMKDRFKKMQLRGGNNKIYIEAYDLVKFEDYIIDYLTTYLKALEIIEYELTSEGIQLSSIYGDE